MGKYDDYEDEDEAVEESTSKASKYDDDGGDPDADAGDVVSARKVIKRGWGNAEQTRSADSPFAQLFKVSKDAQLVKFLEDEPYTSFRQHWITREGQRSFVCISDMHAKGCPLCAAGDRPSARFAFNIALMGEDGEPAIKSYEIGPRDIDTLKQFHTDPRQGPLSKHYWAISRPGKANTSPRLYQMVRERDLEDEWNMSPLTSAQLSALDKQKYSESIVAIPSWKTLKDLADEELDVG